MNISSNTTAAATATSNNNAKEFISTKLGGRVFTAAVPVVDNGRPTPLELSFDASLKAFCDEHILLESREGLQRRERVLNRMTEICREWIQSVCRQKGYPVTSGGGCQLLTSGSYRLGVHEPGADIDTILVAPAVCHRSDFFGSTNPSTATNNNTDPEQLTFRDPHSLAERIRRHPDVTNFVPVEGAAVPLLTFDWEGINIDLLFARLTSGNSNNTSVPSNFDVDNDAVLDGADSATEKSLNGPRVTNLIAAFAGGTPERYQAFLTVVRCVRKWAKARGLYSNKMGYWGGVNINLAVALTVQLYPNACAAALLRKFFLVFSNWRWPQPVMLTKPHDAGYGLPVWSLAQAGRQMAPMITPAYPAMNSTLAVSRQTLQIMQEEFRRAHEIVDQLWRTFQQQQQHQPSGGGGGGGDFLDWNKLFDPSDFFIVYPRYLSLCIVGPTQTDTQAWAGFVESRLRKLVSDILGRSLPLRKIQLWPKKISACVADPTTSLLTVAQRQNSITYFIGFVIDRLRMRGEQLNVEGPLQNFREYELSRFHPVVQGMDIIFKDFKVKKLPGICFDGIYESKLVAMKKRRQMRDNDPARIERKTAARLDELKSKMANLHERKQKKRSRNTDDNLDDDEDEEHQPEEEKASKVARLEASESEAATEKNETAAEENLLENALETLQQPEGDKRPTENIEQEALLDGYESDENVVGYSKDDVRQAFQQPKIVKKNDVTAQKIINTRCLPVSEEIARALESIGMPIVPDSEVEVIGAVPPVTSSSIMMKPPEQSGIKFSLIDNFDVVELDENGHVIDKGDENFTPSNSWIGRKPGFEFKLGERGLGYYRTGKKVVVPSNMAY